MALYLGSSKRLLKVNSNDISYSLYMPVIGEKLSYFDVLVDGIKVTTALARIVSGSASSYNGEVEVV